MNRRHHWGREFAAPLNTLQDDLQRLFEHYRNGGATPTAARPGEAAPPDPESAWTPPIDLSESPEEVVLWVDLPGVDPASVELMVSGRILSIKGEKPRDPADRAHGRTLERPFGPFFRQVELPADVDMDAIQAEARHGVLSIRLPKREAAQRQTIPIRISTP